MYRVQNNKVVLYVDDGAVDGSTVVSYQRNHNVRPGIVLLCSPHANVPLLHIVLMHPTQPLECLL